MRKNVFSLLNKIKKQKLKDRYLFSLLNFTNQNFNDVFSCIHSQHFYEEYGNKSFVNDFIYCNELQKVFFIFYEERKIFNDDDISELRAYLELKYLI